MGRGSVEILMLRLGCEELRRVIEKALAGKDGAKFVYQSELFEKLKKHGVTIQDVLHVCRGWEVLHDVRRDGVSWRYKICGWNCDDKWMAVVLAVNDHSDVIAITGFRFSRGRR